MDAKDIPVWNAAIEAAALAVEQSPVFGKMDSLAQDVANLTTLHVAQRKVRALKEPVDE